MANPSSTNRTLSPINTHWQNRSHSSVTSEAGTFHSAHAHASPMELSHLSTGQGLHYPRSSISALHPLGKTSILPTPQVESIKMSRQDSGFEDGTQSASNSPRTSISSTRHLRSSTTPSGGSRPSPKRGSRSAPGSTQMIRTPTSSRRPSLQARQAATSLSPATTVPYQFFQFPTLVDPDAVSAPPPPPPPPVTCQYWTSDSTRRLEYAAIDAASRGVRGFFIKLVPDCILPPSSRRTKFHCSDADSDAGSVRRYRLALPEEKGSSRSDEVECSENRNRPSGLRRWTAGAGLWKKSA